MLIEQQYENYVSIFDPQQFDQAANLKNQISLKQNSPGC